MEPSLSREPRRLAAQAGLLPHSTDATPSEPRLDRAGAERLLDIAESTIATALLGNQPVLPRLDSLPAGLHRPGGVFVTLTVAGRLNGCIGDVEGTEPLAHAVARLALSAAFADPRLPALRPVEFTELTIELSLMSPLSPIDAGSRPELLDALRPFHDGLVIRARDRRALFLPTVWEQLPDPDDFLDQLWRKAGLQPGTWPRGLHALRFGTEHHERRVSGPLSATYDRAVATECPSIPTASRSLPGEPPANHVAT
jgi:AmmeMemoRadiSam system protein A